MQSEKPPLPPHMDVKKAYSQIYDHYQNEISRAFLNKEKQIRRQRKKRKVSLSITSKNNRVENSGIPNDEIENNMRIYNREHVNQKKDIN